LGDDEMSIETYIQMEGEEIIELELNIDELVDVALGINRAQGFDLNVDMHSIDVDDVTPTAPYALETTKICGPTSYPHAYIFI
jgi:hypothetical protein